MHRQLQPNSMIFYTLLCRSVELLLGLSESIARRELPPVRVKPICDVAHDEDNWCGSRRPIGPKTVFELDIVIEESPA